jgi:type II secretory pathway pseudopilin PulG
MRRASNPKSGFTLLELLISASLGLLVLAGAVSMFTQALKATWITSEKSEMQQDFRAASNLLRRDISLAGAGAMGQQGLAYNAVGLPNTVKNPIYPCSSTVCDYVKGSSVAYPGQLLYSIMPGPSLGITVDPAIGPTDIISLAIADVSLELNCYTLNVTSSTTVNFGLPSPLPATCILPTGVTDPPPLVWSDTNAAGLQAGDMILFGANNVVGVVTNVTSGTPSGACYTPLPSTTPPVTYTIPSGNCYTVTFANESGAAPDPGYINQKAVATGTGIFDNYLTTHMNGLSAVRLLLITYYLDISPVDGVTPRLMRIQNGRTPAPVAENVVNLKFTYDVNNNGVINANQSTLPVGTTPEEITQVNINHMTIRSQLSGSSGYQGLDLHTSISARNLTSQQEYPLAPGS